MTKQVKKIALTGGPCGGKSTALTMLQQKLGDYGYYPILVPEAATLLKQFNIAPPGALLGRHGFQRRVASLTMKLEGEGDDIAQAVQHPQPVIITDRAIVDMRPYAESLDAFLMLLTEQGLDYDAAMERYNAVMHLRTAAFGAEKFYTLANNPARWETPQQARDRDDATVAAWEGHEHRRVIGNDGTFEDKMKRLLQEVCIVLGIPEPVEIERKYLVAGPIPVEQLGSYQIVRIEQFYLLSSDPSQELRFRKREQYGSASYYRTVKRPGPDRVSRYETQESITAAEYEFGKQFQRPGSHFVRKERFCFVYENQQFELDYFQKPSLPYALLEIELAEPGQEIKLPPFLNIEREVTEDKRYSNFALATS